MDNTGVIKYDEAFVTFGATGLKTKCKELELSDLDVSISSNSDALDKFINVYKELKSVLSTYHEIFSGDIADWELTWNTINIADINANQNIKNQIYPGIGPKTGK